MATLNKLLLCFVIILGVTLVSCDEVPVVIPMGQTGPLDPNPTDSTVRVVLLQELTGVKCPNCPTGAAEAKRLLGEYGEQLVVMAIHGSFLTQPLAESKYDFRTEFSRVIESNTPFLGKPAAAINRRLFDGPPFLAFDVDDWEPLIQQELAETAEINIDLSASEAAGVLSVEVDLTPIVDLAGGYNIVVALTQGGIQDVQEENGNILEDYEHEHVLRHMFTAPLGDILGSDLVGGEIISKNYTFDIPSTALPLYDLDHLEIIAYITRDGASESPVIQAAKTHL